LNKISQRSRRKTFQRTHRKRPDWPWYRIHIDGDSLQGCETTCHDSTRFACINATSETDWQSVCHCDVSQIVRASSINRNQLR